MTTTKLEGIIQNLLDTHKGGEKYFDNFDAEMLKEENLDIVLSIFEPYKGTNIAVSGKFGSYALELYKKGIIECKTIIRFNGGLRKGFIKEIEYIGDHNWAGKGFVFIDDSFYRGRTRNRINQFLNVANSRIVHTSVVYDGSIEKDEKVTSLFRYHGRAKA